VAAAELRARYTLPIIGIEPALKPASEVRRDGSILVLATPMTLKLEKFRALYERYGEGAIPLPCPGLMELVEAEDTVWQGQIFDVSRLTVELPDGRHALRDVVRHPGAVAIVALTDDGRICLVRQYRAALGRVTVEVPAGKLDPGEDPLECAHRELLEETGMRAGRMAFLTTMATGAGFCDELIHLYMATDLAFAHSDPDADEFINVDLVPVGELVDAVLDGRIEDAKTVIGALICDAVAHRLGSEQG
jgi:ADP-ribose pyrophosphatase